MPNNDYVADKKKLIIGKKMQQVPLNCYIVIVLFLLTLNTTLPNECNPYNPLDFALSTMMKSRSVVIKE